MTILPCPNCKTKVIPTSAGECPACRTKPHWPEMTAQPAPEKIPISTSNDCSSDGDPSSVPMQHEHSAAMLPTEVAHAATAAEIVLTALAWMIWIVPGVVYGTLCLVSSREYGKEFYGWWGLIHMMGCCIRMQDSKLPGGVWVVIWFSPLIFVIGASEMFNLPPGHSFNTDLADRLAAQNVEIELSILRDRQLRDEEWALEGKLRALKRSLKSERLVPDLFSLDEAPKAPRTPREHEEHFARQQELERSQQEIKRNKESNRPIREEIARKQQKLREIQLERVKIRLRVEVPPSDNQEALEAPEP